MGMRSKRQKESFLNESSLYTDKEMLNHALCRPGDLQWTYSNDMGSPFRSLSLITATSRKAFRLADQFRSPLSSSPRILDSSQTWDQLLTYPNSWSHGCSPPPSPPLTISIATANNTVKEHWWPAEHFSGTISSYLQTNYTELGTFINSDYINAKAPLENLSKIRGPTTLRIGVSMSAWARLRRIKYRPKEKKKQIVGH